MKKIYGLFSDQEEAGNAIEALSNAGFEDADIHTVEDSNNVERSPVAVAPTNQGGFGSATALPYPNFLSELEDSETRDFVHHSLQNGGALVVVEPGDEDEFSQIKRILEKEGGQITSS